MSPSRIAVPLVLLASALSAQNTWVVDPSGGGNFTSLAAAHAAAASGDTLILRGTMHATAPLTKTLHLNADAATVWSTLVVQATGPMSITGGTFESLWFTGTNASLDGVTGTVRLQGGATVVARGCTFVTSSNLAALVEDGTRAVFDTCTFQGRDAYAVFGVVPAAPGMRVFGRAELRSCTLTGGQGFTSGTFSLAAAPAIDLPGNVAGNVDLRNCVLISGLGAPLISGTGNVQAHNTTTQGATPTPPSVVVVQALLPWTTGTSAAPGGVLQAQVDGPAATLAVTFASLGMRPPSPSNVGEIWTDPFPVVLTIGLTDPNGAMSTAVAVPLQVQRGLQLTFQSLVAPGSAISATAPAILHVR